MAQCGCPGHPGLHFLESAPEPKRNGSYKYNVCGELPIEAVSLVAEVAVGLAGFAGVAVALGRGPGHWSAGDALRIRLLLVAAFSALFSSLTATGAQLAGLEDTMSIKAGAGALVIGQSYWLFFLAPRIRRLEPSQRSLFSGRLAILFVVLAATSIVGQLLVIIDLAGPGTFFLGLIASLGYASFGFVRLLFIRPESQ